MNWLKKKISIFHILSIILISLLIVLIIVRNDFIFGSNVDWIKQSVSFPEYFRNLFYKTNNLFPNLAIHLGSGQNIYYFSYYGLYSPITLLSYLLPFIRMGDYIMIISVLNIIVSVILFYRFLIKSNYKKTDSFLTSLLFLSSSSFIFNSHRHFMFVSYMGFLILALTGVKKYFDSNKSLLLILSISFMILTSYYFSFSSILVIILYAIYYQLKIKTNNGIKEHLTIFFKFLLRIIVSIMITSFCLLPTIYLLFNNSNRDTLLSSISLSYFIPSIDSKSLFYQNVGVGLTSIIWISIIYSILYLKKENKFLAGALLIIFSFPIFNLFLNGMLYLHNKVFIAFIPLVLVLFIDMINDINKNDRKKFILIIISVLSSIFLLRFNYPKRYYRDLIVTLVLIFLYTKRKKYLYFIPIILFSFYICIQNSLKDDLISRDEYKNIYNSNYSSISNYLNNNTDSIYRFHNDINTNLINYSSAFNYYSTSLYSSISNNNYIDTFYNTFNNNDRHRNFLVLYQNSNLFFLKFMGIRYLISDKDAPYNYSKIREFDNKILYENKNTYSIGYASNHLLSYDDYNNLSFIEKQEAFLNNIIIDEKSSNSNLNFDYENYPLKYKDIVLENISVDKNNNHYIINSLDNGKIILELDEEISDKVLVIRFNMNKISSCSDLDLAITINDIKNVLSCSSSKYFNNNKTFDYVISSNNSVDELNITFAKGEYDISDIKLYTINKSFFDNLDITPLKIDFNKIGNDSILGNISIEDDSYFIFTIPYDKGYTILVDNKKVNIEKVNDGFLGFYLEKGNHEIKLSFKAPFSDIGKIISIIGILLLISICINEQYIHIKKK